MRSAWILLGIVLAAREARGMCSCAALNATAEGCYTCVLQSDSSLQCWEQDDECRPLRVINFRCDSPTNSVASTSSTTSALPMTTIASSSTTPVPTTELPTTSMPTSSTTQTPTTGVLSTPEPHPDVQGFTIGEISFGSNCPSGRCWEIDLLFDLLDAPTEIVEPPVLRRSSSSSGETSVMFMSRVKRVSNGSEYTSSFLDTFDPKSFPCNTLGYDPMIPSREETSCCLLDLADNYYVTPTFKSWVADRRPQLTHPTGQCHNSTGSTLINDAGDFILGEFIPGIYIAPLEEPGQNSSVVWRAKMFIDGDALQEDASIYDEQDGLMHFFLGMAHFTPTGLRVMVSRSRQVNITLQREKYWTVASIGTSDQYFISFFNVRIHQVLAPPNDPTGRGLAGQYAQVTLILDKGLQPNQDTGLFPLNSIRTSLVTGGDPPVRTPWVEACSSPLSANFYSIIDQSCGPQVDMCVQPPVVSQTDQFATINIPLGLDFVQPSDWASGSSVDRDDKLNMELALSVKDATGLASKSLLSISTSFRGAPGAVTSWCATRRGPNLYDLVQSTLLVGSTTSDLSEVQQVDLRTEGQTVSVSTVSANLDPARSFESGMLTLALSGDDDFFGVNASDDSVHVEEMITLHINGDNMWAAVSAVLLAPDPFLVGVDYAADTALLEPNAALALLCPIRPTSTLNSCATRKVVSNKMTTTNAYDLSDGVSGAANFMDKVMNGWNTGNPFALELGQRYYALLKDEFELNGRYNRAWWVDTAFRFEGAAAFSLSQRVVMVAVLSVREGDRRRRRLMMASSDPEVDVQSMPVTTVNFGFDSLSVAAAMQGVPQQRASLLHMQLTLTDTEACMDTSALTPALEQRVVGLLSSMSTGVSNLMVAETTIERGSANCEGPGERRRRNLLQTTGPSVDLNLVILFEEAAADGSKPTLDTNKLKEQAGVLSLTVLKPPGPDSVVMGPIASPPDDTPTSNPDSPPPQPDQDENAPPTLAGDDSGESSSSGSISIALLASVAVGAVALVTVVGVGCWLKHRRSDSSAQQLQNPTPKDKSKVEGQAKSKLKNLDKAKTEAVETADLEAPLRTVAESSQASSRASTPKEAWPERKAGGDGETPAETPVNRQTNTPGQFSSSTNWRTSFGLKGPPTIGLEGRPESV